MDRSQKCPGGDLPPEFEHTEHCDRTCGGTGGEPYGGVVFDRARRLYLTTQYGGDQSNLGSCLNSRDSLTARGRKQFCSHPGNKRPLHPCGKRKSLQNPPNTCYSRNEPSRAFEPRQRPTPEALQKSPPAPPPPVCPPPKRNSGLLVCGSGVIEWGDSGPSTVAPTFIHCLSFPDRRAAVKPWRIPPGPRASQRRRETATLVNNMPSRTGSQVCLGQPR